MIFGKNFAHEGLKYSVDSWTENQFMIILNSTWMSLIAIFLLGVCAIFMNFMFVRIIYNHEIKEAAHTMLKIRKKNNNDQEEWIKSQQKQQKSKLPLIKRILFSIRELI
jgi:hypothetical protein